MSEPSGLYPHSPDPALRQMARRVRPGAWRRNKSSSAVCCVALVPSPPGRRRKKRGQFLHSGAEELTLKLAKGGHRQAGGITGTYQNGEERGERQREEEREERGGGERETEGVSRIAGVTAATSDTSDAPADATIMTFFSNQKEIGQKWKQSPGRPRAHGGQ